MMALFGLLVTGWASISVPAKEQAAQEIAADTVVNNFMNYRAAVIGYLAANPATSEGVIPAASITAYMPPGVSVPSGMAHYWKTSVGGAGVAQPDLYVFSTTVVGVREAKTAAKRMHGSIRVGLASGGTPKYLISPIDSNATIVLPTVGTLQSGALVAVGR